MKTVVTTLFGALTYLLLITGCTTLPVQPKAPAGLSPFSNYDCIEFYNSCGKP